MEINVKDLTPNPYRDMDNYPIDRDKVNALRVSIDETTFWDNVLVREKKGKFQIAYGHHRLLALQELKIEKIEAPVKEISDLNMIRIMANENFEQWKLTTNVVIETVKAAKKFIEDKLQRYEKWELFEKTELNKALGFTDAQTFSAAKGKLGVGRKMILSFLGENWKDWMIKESLEVLGDESLDEDAIKKAPTMTGARKLRKAIKEHDIPKEEQKEFVEEIIADDDEPDIEETVKKATPKVEISDADQTALEEMCKIAKKVAIKAGGRVDSLIQRIQKLGIIDLEDYVESGLAEVTDELLKQIRSLKNYL